MTDYTYRCEVEGLCGVQEILEALKPKSRQIRRIELQPADLVMSWQVVLTTTLPPKEMQLIFAGLNDPFPEITLQEVTPA